MMEAGQLIQLLIMLYRLRFARWRLERQRRARP
jgi:hypothetical protein